MSLELYKLNDTEKNRLFNSTTQQLNIEKLQSYYPIFQLFIENERYKNEKNLIIDSKFKCIEILGKLDPELLEEDLLEVDSNSESEDEIDELRDNLIRKGNIDDELDEEEKIRELEKDEDSDDSDDEEEKMIQEIEQELRLKNTFSILAKVQIAGVDGEFEQKLFVKKSPLLEPIKVLMDIYSLETTGLPDSKLSNTIAKINSYNNCSHVEASFLFIGSKLVELGKCPSFPYYYGCLNGYDSDFHADITDEYDELKNKSWFLDKIQNDYELVIVDMSSDDMFSKSYDNNLFGSRYSNDSGSSEDIIQRGGQEIIENLDDVTIVIGTLG